MTNPKYATNDKLYLRESAALGFLEAVMVSEIRNRGGSWLYGYQQVASYQPLGLQAIGAYGDRRSFVNGATILLDESELVSYGEALDMAITNAQQQLDHLHLLRAAAP